MSEFFGDGVSRTLSAKQRQFTNIIWQKGKPPLDSEFNLHTQMSEDARQAIIAANVSSGWMGNAYDAMSDYEFDPQASNMFWLGKEKSNTDGDVLWANVNGWLLPVAGTRTQSTRNAVKLPPPSGVPSESDVNFVFLEVWKAQISPDGSVNKPAENLLYRYGNVEYGGTNLPNDLLDPAILKETTERVQLQYRIRVASSVNPALFPQGFNANIKGQGTLDNPTLNANPMYQFQNMGKELGDPGLWRAGDGDGENGLFKTVDGYVYAIPICFVFRRTTLSWNRTQQHGAPNRNPSMTDRSEAIVLPTVSLAEDITKETSSFSVDVPRSSTTFPATGFLKIGNEIIEYSWTGTDITATARGARLTYATNHEEGDAIDFVSGHPLGLFSDQIVHDDILDLRHVISMDGLDYDGLLRQNFHKLVKGELASTWKRSFANVKGKKHFQIDYFGADSVAPDYTIKADAPDGKRKIFSDACVLQPNNMLVLGTSGTSATTPDFTLNPLVTVHRFDAAGAENWNMNDVILIGLDQFRSTFPVPAPNNRKVRFVHPFEYSGNAHDPVRLWFGDTDPTSGDPLKQAPLVFKEDDTSPPFVVLGSRLTQFTPTEQQADLDFLSGNPGTITITGTTFTPSDEDVLLEEGAWILITPGTDPTSSSPENHGAFKIVGVDGSGNLEVVGYDGSAVIFDEIVVNRSWSIRVPRCHEDDENIAIVLTEAVATNQTLSMTYDLLYHPARGISRVPDDGLFVDLDAGVASNYVRETRFANVADSASPAVRKSAVVPLTTFPHRHNHLQLRDRQSPASSIESVWSEAYVDRGSKTLLYQPMRRVQMRSDSKNNPGAVPYSDPTGLFNLTPAAANACTFLPKEVRPPLGRMDLPFIKSKAPAPATSTNPAYGLNCLMTSGSSDVNNGYIQQRMVAVYDPVNTVVGNFGDYSDLSTIGAGPGGLSALVCRYYDKGGVRGIEIPAHFGIARLFAIHLQEDFYTISPGNSILSAGSTYRIASGVNRPNILREDGERRSLIITDENTFVIPEDVIDQSYFENDLESTPLIFEFAAFFFGEWKDDLTRIHRLTTVVTPTEDLRLYINGPAEPGDEFFLVSTRIPYQGSIYGTMPSSAVDSESIDYVDYTPKRNTETPAQVLGLLTDLAQEEDMRIENPSTLEIVAALPFATTLGTGAVAGTPVSGSYTDVGYLDSSGFPFSSILDPERSSRTRGHLFAESGMMLSPALSDSLCGATERLPLGNIVKDYHFMGEGFGQEYKRFWTPDVSLEATEDIFMDRRLGKNILEGYISFSDGTSGLVYDTTTLYRTYRGGVVLSGNRRNPGGAFMVSGGRHTKDATYLNDPDAKNHQVHGAVLFGIAFLVRNTQEEVTNNDVFVSAGDELQMVVVTGMTLGKELDLTGDVSREFADLLIQMHPMGAGEGFCAADRFRIEGRPLQKKMRNAEPIDAVMGRDPIGPVAPPSESKC